MKYQRLVLLIIATLGFTALQAQERGKASYYSNKLHGARMSDGTRYHRDSMTCASLRYPLGTVLKVTNVNNQKSVVVKVTDRGPHTRGRIIDLSYAAAKQIGMISAGIVTVRVERYTEQSAIPFRAEEKTEIPSIDFEFTDTDDDGTPIWRRSEEIPIPVSVKREEARKKDEAKKAEGTKKAENTKHADEDKKVNETKKVNEGKKGNETKKANEVKKTSGTTKESTRNTASPNAPAVSRSNPHKASQRHQRK